MSDAVSPVFIVVVNVSLNLNEELPRLLRLSVSDNNSALIATALRLSNAVVAYELGEFVN